MIMRRVTSLMVLGTLTSLALLLSSRDVSRATAEQGRAREHEIPACIVIVHLGDGKELAGLPMQQVAQIIDNVEQIRLFNPRIPVFVVVSPDLRLTAGAASRLAAAQAQLVTTDALPLTQAHTRWQQESKMAKTSDRNFFWRYTSERFFYLSDLAVSRQLTNIIHIVRVH